MSYKNIREEELKNKIAKKYFGVFDSTKIIGDIDFCVTLPIKKDPLSETVSLFWAEAKKGKSDVYKSIVQLILTIGKARTFDKQLPPAFLGAFDYEKIVFIAYNEIQEIFYLNDFNWNVRPSNHNTKEFKIVYDKVKKKIEDNYLLFVFDNDEKELKKFIKNNFIFGKFGITKTQIDKNNFINIYNKWLQTVKPSIAVNWNIAKKNGIIDGDFYLADLLSLENETFKEKLFVLLQKNKYELDRKINESGIFFFKTAFFKDKQKAHNQFWNKYERPPKEEYWDYIIKRRDLLVPQDIRERKGSFFTPQIWVELSQRYLTDVLGEDWQEEYYIWDCAAGTGNLLASLTNKHNIWASTLDKQDVIVMKDRIENGANLLASHAFQFDFLNDNFSKLPESLRQIINNSEKRKKLVIYINPPYAEASDKKTLKRKKGKKGVEQSAINKKYANLLGQGNAELFAQFFIRIHEEIPNCIIAEFSTLKILQGQHFIDFRNNFKAKLENLFIVPADTFDNVKGKFPIGFFIWNTQKKETFKNIYANVYDKTRNFIGKKKFEAYIDSQYINDWIKPFRANKKDKNIIGKFPFKGNDFQNQNMIIIVHQQMVYNKAAGQFLINSKNLILASIYFTVRKSIKATWFNDRDQFLYPNNKWQNDKEFQNDCLSFTLFSNNIQSKYGTNHWIPFSENEINSQEKFESNFMVKFIQGKLKSNGNGDLLEKEKVRRKSLEFSVEAKFVFDAGRELWRYYHTQLYCNENASLYDIRAYFQGRNVNGRMNNKSKDEKYTKLITDLRNELKNLAKKIEPKIYKYGFLKV